MTICSHKSIQIYNKWSLFIYQNTCRICGKLELPRIRPVLLPQPPVLLPWSVCIGWNLPLRLTRSPRSPSPSNQLCERLCLEPMALHLSCGWTGKCHDWINDITPMMLFPKKWSLGNGCLPIHNIWLANKRNKWMAATSVNWWSFQNVEILLWRMLEQDCRWSREAASIMWERSGELVSKYTDEWGHFNLCICAIV